MSALIKVIEMRSRNHFTDGVIHDWGDWIGIYGFFVGKDAQDELAKLQDDESQKFSLWKLEEKPSTMFVLHEYRIAELRVF